MGHIVVGVDETPQAAAALRLAADEALARRSRLTVVLAWDLLSQHHADPDEPFDPFYGDTQARDALARIVRRVLGPAPPVPIEQLVVFDLPVPALLDAACDADLLVVGARDVHGLERALTTSVSRRCRRRRPCPMLIVHSDGHRETVGAT